MINDTISAIDQNRVFSRSKQKNRSILLTTTYNKTSTTIFYRTGFLILVAHRRALIFQKRHSFTVLSLYEYIIGI